MIFDASPSEPCWFYYSRTSPWSMTVLQREPAAQSSHSSIDHPNNNNSSDADL
jgi:hypothetical protein